MKKTLVALIAALALAFGGYGLFRAGVQNGATQVHGSSGSGEVAGSAAAPRTGPAQVGTSAATTPSPSNIDPKTGRRVLYWHDPMVPGQKFDKPGKSPFMDMQLAPVFADDANAGGGIAIDPRMQQSLGIRTAQVTRGKLEQSLDAVGTVAFNERDVAVVQARANGFVERLFVRAPLDPVRKGAELAELYIPDWVAAQEEYLTVRRMKLGDQLVDGARQRMRLAGMSEETIAQVEATASVQPRIKLLAPISGVVVELGAREGMTVMNGAPLFRLNGLGSVWVNAEVPETFAGMIRPGISVEATTTALPGRTFRGKVSAVLPEVNATTRTLKARVELANPGGQLVPGMFARIAFAPTGGGDRLLVPAEAVIRTGRRTIVMTVLDTGRFAAVDVEIGTEANGQVEVRKGLREGQKVVVSGQFLIDSEASLKGVETRMNESPAPAVGGATGNGAAAPASAAASGMPTPLAQATGNPAPKPGGNVHRGSGKIESITGNEVTLEHGPIASLKWPPMTMGFRLAPGSAPRGLKPGDAVDFEFREAKGGQYEIVTITPAARTSEARTSGARK